MYANFNQLKEFLQQFKQPFGFVLVSGTWFNDNKGIHFDMDGYNLNYINRENKTGGGSVCSSND